MTAVVGRRGVFDLREITLLPLRVLLPEKGRRVFDDRLFQEGGEAVAYFFDDAYYEGVAHEEGALGVGGICGVVVGEHIGALEFYGCEAAELFVLHHHVFETAGGLATF